MATVCVDCGESLPVQIGRGGHRQRCERCSAVRRRAKQHEYRRTHAIRNPDAAKLARRRNQLATRYRMTIEDFEALLDAQFGLCAICAADLKTRAPRSVHVDHDHATGAVRGVLCNDCNRGLGGFLDQIDRLMAAATYLIQHTTISTTEVPA